MDISLWWLNNHLQQSLQQPKQACKKEATSNCWIQVGSDGLRRFIDGRIIKVFTEAIIQRQGSKSRPAINRATHSHKQLRFDVQLHVCHSRHACLRLPPSNLAKPNRSPPVCLSASLSFPLSQKHNYRQKCTETWLLTLTILLLTSTKELQVADLFSDLQLEDLLEDLLPQRLLDDSHPLELLPVQTQQCPSCPEEEHVD